MVIQAWELEGWGSLISCWDRERCPLAGISWSSLLTRACKWSARLRHRARMSLLIPLSSPALNCTVEQHHAHGLRLARCPCELKSALAQVLRQGKLSKELRRGFGCLGLASEGHLFVGGRIGAIVILLAAQQFKPVNSDYHFSAFFTASPVGPFFSFN